MSNVIAGPVIGGTLARFGADVLKLDPTEPTYDGLVAVLMGVPPNRGKRSVLVDITKSRGPEVFQKLLSWADVVIINQVKNQLHGIQADEDTLKRINPDLVICRFDAFGGPGWGPLSDKVRNDDPWPLTSNR